MDIGSVLRSYSAGSAQSTNAVSQPDLSIPPPNTDSVSGTGASASQVQVSQPGQLMRQLSDLSKSDPTKFKEVVQQLSDSFDAAAQNATGEDATRLSELADKFAQAAESGDMLALRPQHAQQGVSGSQDAQRSYVRHSAGARHHAPSQAMQDAFSSALSIVQNATTSTSTASAA